MHCTNRGSTIDDDSAFCTYCGNTISRPDKPTPQPQPQQRPQVPARAQTPVQDNNANELRKLRAEVTALRRETKRKNIRSNWAQQQQSCCQCFIGLIIFAVIFGIIMQVFFWDMFWDFW